MCNCAIVTYTTVVQVFVEGYEKMTATIYIYIYLYV